MWALGAKVDWIEAQKKVIANSNNEDNITVELLIGSEKYWVDKQEREMDVAPFIIREESRTYIPARYITEGLSYKIDFAKGGRVVYVVSFTRGQTEKEMQEVINEILEIYESKPQTEVGLPANIQWGSKTNKLTPEQRSKLEKIEIGPNAKLPLGSPDANTFNMAEDGYSHILETMQLNSNQAFFSSKDFMCVRAGCLITVRGELLTKNSDGSITVQMVDVWARKSPVVWNPTVMLDLETDEYLSRSWRR